MLSNNKCLERWKGAMARTKDNQKNTDKSKKTKAASPKNRKKAGAGAGSNPLKRSFDACSSSSQATTPSSPSDIQKCHQSGFITYAKAAAASKDPARSEQASNVLDMYRTMSPQQKKELVVSFFKAGGQTLWLGCGAHPSCEAHRHSYRSLMVWICYPSDDHGLLQGQP